MNVREIAWVAGGEEPRVRVARFVRRSPVPIERVAALANAIAVRLEELLATPIGLRILPPVEIEDEDWERLREGSHAYEFGERADAMLVFDEAAARRIVGAAFGETPPERPMSPLETRVLDRCMRRLVEGLDATHLL